jgi:hypothetical protein
MDEIAVYLTPHGIGVHLANAFFKINSRPVIWITARQQQMVNSLNFLLMLLCKVPRTREYMLCYDVIFVTKTN